MEVEKFTFGLTDHSRRKVVERVELAIKHKHLPFFSNAIMRQFRNFFQQIHSSEGIPLELVFVIHETDDEFHPVLTTDDLSYDQNQQPRQIHYHPFREGEKVATPHVQASDHNWYMHSPDGFGYSYAMYLPRFHLHNNAYPHFEVFWFCEQAETLLGGRIWGPHFLVPVGSGYYAIELSAISTAK